MAVEAVSLAVITVREVTAKNFHGISYTVVSSAMPRSAARRIDGCKLWL
jgi:hypothetical protein